MSTRLNLTRPLVALLLAALAATCGNDSRSPTEIAAHAQRIRMVSGDSQTGRALGRLAEPFTVQVLDNEGNPVPAFSVRFQVTSVAGLLAGSNSRSSDVVTNNNGMTSVYLTLGASADIQYTVEASASMSTGQALQGSPVRFTAHAASSADTTTGGDGGGGGTATSAFSMTGTPLGADTTGSAGRFFKLPLAVQVVDSLGKPVKGLTVYYTAVQGGGAFDITEKTTDDYGVASNQLRLGYQVGANLITASAVLPDGKVVKVEWRIWSRLDPDVRYNAYDISMVTQDSLAAPAGSTLPVPLVVAVTDTFGRGSPNQSVTWTVEHAGTLTTVVSNTNSEGIAQITFTLGPNVGLNRVRATIIRDNGEERSVYVNVWGTAGTVAAEPDSLVLVSGGGQRAEVGSILPLPVVLAVLDEDGSRMANVDVKLTITTPISPYADNEGRIGVENEQVPGQVVLNLTSDANGLIVFIWQLGPGPDLENTVVAEIRRNDGTQRNLTVHAEALPHPDTANRLVIMSGNYQVPQPVSTELPLPLVMRVVDTTRVGVNGDTLGAPITNFPVIMTAYGPSRDGSLNASGGEPGGTGRLTARTDKDGLVAARWTTGSLTGRPDDLASLLNNNSVVAVAVFADGSQDSVIFFTTAVPQAAQAMSVSGTTELSGTAGKSLTLPTINVVDQYGNVKAGVGVYFSIGTSPGPAQIAQSSMSTDIYGNATGVVSQLSTRSGEMKVSAANGSLNGSPVTFTITVEADAAASIQKAGGDGQTTKSGTAWSNEIKVLVRDQYGNAKPGQYVTFSVTTGSATLKQMLVPTDGDGFASTTATPLAVGNVS
ncbi:Ig-like domain-containing protein, partial [bacterium]|nr:Ig-like domain-containing protein [bacterium]